MRKKSSRVGERENSHIFAGMNTKIGNSHTATARVGKIFLSGDAATAACNIGGSSRGSMAITKRKYKSGKVVWSYAFDAPGSGRATRHQITGSGFATKGAAMDAEANRRVEAQMECKPGVAAATTHLPTTLGGMLDQFFQQHCEGRLARKSVERYREQVGYLSIELRKMALSEVKPLHLTVEWNRLLQSGGHHRKTKAARPLSSKTVRDIAGVVSSAYNKAIRWQLAQSNPVPASDPPVAKRREASVLMPSQQRLVIDAAMSTWGMSAFLELDAALGARRGELLALRWSDFAGESVSIERSLSQTRAGLEFKGTKSGRPREITVPATAIAVLKAHRAKQQSLRHQFGPTYRGDLDLVFCNPDGTPMKPDSVSAKVSLHCRKLKLPKGSSLHTLRHSHATHLLLSGVSPTVVSKRLGHANTSTTLNIYSHSLPGADAEAARKWEEFQERAEKSSTPYSHPV
jgi:integrase